MFGSRFITAVGTKMVTGAEARHRTAGGALTGPGGRHGGLHRLAVVFAVVALTGCSGATPTPSPIAQSAQEATPSPTSAPTLPPTPSPTATLPAGMCQIPNLDGYWSKDVDSVWARAGFTGSADIISSAGDPLDAGFSVDRQDPAYPGIAPCETMVTAYGTAPTPSPAPTRDPSAAFEPTEDQLTAACEHGTPIPEMAAFAGTTHPYIQVRLDNGTWQFSVGTKGADPYSGFVEYQPGVLAANGLEPVQVIVCHLDAVKMKGDPTYCGIYTDPNGNTADVKVSRMSEIIRVVVAQTGETLKEKTFAGDPPTCPSTVTRADIGSYPDPGVMDAWVQTLTGTYQG